MFKLISMFCVLLVLSACAGLDAKREADAPLRAEAESRLKSSDYQAASRIYQQLAEHDYDVDYYRLLAANAELRAGNLSSAQTLLSVVDPDKLEKVDQYRYALLRSRIDLSLGKAQSAMARLEPLDPKLMRTDFLEHYHTLRASAYNQLGNMLASARERVALGQLLTSQEAVKKNNEAIFDALNRLPESALNSNQPGALGGWMSLVSLLKKNSSQQAIQAWQAAHPQHPANGSFLEALMPKEKKVIEITPLKSEDMPISQAVTGKFIGVMLPMTGAYAPAAQAIRAGMMAAFDADSNASKLPLRFVDTQGADLQAQYKQWVGEGVQAIVGPLIKDDLTNLMKGLDPSVTILGLNQIPEVTHEKLFQFGLTPEQEVEQVSGSAWFDNHQNALVLAPSSAFGQRMISHFSAYWKSLGGKSLMVKTYVPGADDFQAPVKELLAASSGGQADFIFMIADARDGRLLKSYLASQAGPQIPVYATSQVFAGKLGDPRDQDLTGVIFCDIPWLLNVDSNSLSRQNLQALTQQTTESYVRLIAMGLDAYHLLPQLEQLKAHGRFTGSTGILSLQSGNRFQRQLQCAQFSGSSLQPRGLAPLLQPGTP